MHYRSGPMMQNHSGVDNVTRNTSSPGSSRDELDAPLDSICCLVFEIRKMSFA